MGRLKTESKPYSDNLSDAFEGLPPITWGDPRQKLAFYDAMIAWQQERDLARRSALFTGVEQYFAASVVDSSNGRLVDRQFDALLEKYTFEDELLASDRDEAATELARFDAKYTRQLPLLDVDPE